MEFVFVPVGRDLREKIGIPPDRGVPVPKDALRDRAVTGTFDLAVMADGIERSAMPSDDRTYDGF